MNVLQICPAYYGRPLFKKLFECLEKNGVNNIIYVPKWHSGPNNQEDNVVIIDKKFSLLSKIIYWGEMCYESNYIQRMVDISKIDIVHAHRLLFGGSIALQLKQKYGVPYIVAIRNSDINCFGRNVNRFRNHCWEILVNSEKIIFISEAYKTFICEKYSQKPEFAEVKNKFLTIPNGIDNAFFDVNPDIKQRDARDKHLSLLTIAEIDKNKNALTTLKACDILIKKGYDISYNCIGNIIDKRIYNKIINKPYSNYLGKCSKEQIIDFLNKTDIFVMPSIHETFGIVYAESISQGVPIVFTRGEGFDGQYNEGEIGYSVNCYNAQEIAARIIDILSDYRNISKRCIDYSHKYSWDIISCKYKEIYNECVI